MNSESENKKLADTTINKSVLYDPDPKILKTYNIHYSQAESFANFCDWLHISSSRGVEYAMIEFMQAHVSEIPAKVTFNLTAKLEPAPRAQCGFKDCKEEAVARAVWRRKTEYMLCEDHYQEAQGNREFSKLERLNNDLEGR